jgi:hypothetical protein
VTPHQVLELTPSYVRPPWDPTRRYNLGYTRAQPIFDFNNGNVIGYLCAAANIDRIVVVEAGTKNVDPAMNTTPPGGTRPWSDWISLYNAPGSMSGPYTTSNNQVAIPTFPNLRDVEYFRYGNMVYVLVTAGGMTDVQHGQSINLDGVWGYEIHTVADATGPAGPVLPAGLTYPAPNWSYTAADYANQQTDVTNPAYPAFARIKTPSGTISGTIYPKRFYPVCAKMLFPGGLFEGNVLITNYTGVTENLARPNVGSRGSGLFGEIFEVNWLNKTQFQDGIIPDRIIPDPFGTDWNDPLNQPAYAERY